MQKRTPPWPARATRNAVVVTVLFAACATYTEAVRPEDPGNPQRAYLYGRFYMKRPPLGGHNSATAATLSRRYPDQTMGLVLRCADGDRYAVRFSQQPIVQAIEVRPSTCAATAVLFDTGPKLATKAAPPTWVHPTEFKAGRAYYLGDYVALTTAEPGVLGTTMTWDMEPAAVDRYDDTTAEMKRTFVALRSLPVEDARLAPKRPPGPAHNDDDAAPLSPDRVARMAPFIKRTFTTPATCAAACPGGQCFPFRGESGPAMTCVVACRGDSDCPAGLGCNCPGGDGAACRQIATTPQDPMKGYCLSTEAHGPRR